MSDNGLLLTELSNNCQRVIVIESNFLFVFQASLSFCLKKSLNLYTNALKTFNESLKEI